MPHFIIHCSERILANNSPDELMQQVYQEADSTGLFRPGDIKIRIQSFRYYNTGNTNSDFIHVFGYIMEGRSDQQKMNLSKKVIAKLKIEFPKVSIVSMNVSDFEQSSYWNRSMV